MKRSLLFLLGVVSVGASAEPAAPASAILRWRNGETLPGEIAEASPTELAWKTPLFEDPLRLRWPALRRIDQTLPAVAAAEPFSIDLRDGSHLYGDLISVTEKSVTMRSARHGDAVLQRSEVLSVRRLRGGSLLAVGPMGDVGWEAIPNAQGLSNVRRPAPAQEAIPALTVGPGGALSMSYWNRSAALKLAQPDLVEIEFRVRSSLRPDFRLSFESGAKQPLGIETWGDQLVLAAADQFQLIRKMEEGERAVALRVCCDRQAKKCAVFTSAGELLVEWHLPDESSNLHAGLVLQNKGRDLSLEFLRVRPWDGKPPRSFDAKAPRLELADGRIIQGQVSDSSADTIHLQTSEQNTETNFSLSEVDAVIFSTDPPRVSESAATLTYADGTILMGRIASIKEGRAAVETAFSEKPLTARLETLRQLLMGAPASKDAPPEPALAEWDEIVIGQTTLHGKLVSAGDAWPRWLPIAGAAPALPSPLLAARITRTFAPDAEFPGADALFYTRGGDIVPGRLRVLDHTGVELESSFIEMTKLPADDLDAIQLGAAARRNLRGFDEAGWRILKGDEKSVHRENGALTLEPGSAYGHPTAMQSSEIRFALEYRNFSTVRLRLFCAGTDGTKAINLALMHTGDRVSAGLETVDGQFENQSQTRVAQGSVSVRLVIQDKQVELHLNDVLMQRFPIDPSKRAGTGLIIEPTGMWGNSVTPVTLSGFSARFVPGRTSLPEISGETKLQALTVPRFRRDDLPRHALLAANGDVLRGEIEAATASHFGFRSGLENLRVPRDRVTAVIWLKPPDKDAPPATMKPAAPNPLDQKISRRTRYSRGNLKSFSSFLQAEAAGLKFKFPEKDDPRQFPMQFGGQTIADALEEICSLYGLRYRLEDGNMIVFETAPQVSKDLVQKVYWLKPAALPSAPPAQEILTAKGVAFPAKATALWEPEARQLTMTNTAANHARLAEVLAADFGGSLGSPTHWLILTSGARLGLAVDKFDTDFISGNHPIYGRCKVPMSDVYVIRTSPPEPAAGRKSLADWRLVLAPEPVLPDTGGESSPSLGKEAKGFKLPLLGGGDFDLAKEKGKVVVLDFWATWCGPCIKALPGLIEALSALPADRVKLIGVNQSEPADQVKRFLETRGWKLTVALDAGQAVARQYGVEGIPHTVIIGPDGKVAWVKTGYSPDGAEEAAKAAMQLLTPTAP